LTGTESRGDHQIKDKDQQRRASPRLPGLSADHASVPAEDRVVNPDGEEPAPAGEEPATAAVEEQVEHKEPTLGRDTDRDTEEGTETSKKQEIEEETDLKNIETKHSEEEDLESSKDEDVNKPKPSEETEEEEVGESKEETKPTLITNLMSILKQAPELTHPSPSRRKTRSMCSSSPSREPIKIKKKYSSKPKVAADGTSRDIRKYFNCQIRDGPIRTNIDPGESNQGSHKIKNTNKGGQSCQLEDN
jgi:hypothetical protein